MINKIKEPYQKWCKKSYKTKCYDIGVVIQFTLFFIVILHAVDVGYLDYLSSIFADNLTFDEEFYDSLTDDDKTRWVFIIFGFISGVTILPLLILHYLTQWFGMGTMYLVWKIHERLNK